MAKIEIAASGMLHALSSGFSHQREAGLNADSASNSGTAGIETGAGQQ